MTGCDCTRIIPWKADWESGGSTEDEVSARFDDKSQDENGLPAGLAGSKFESLLGKFSGAQSSTERFERTFRENR